jgi:hypothetical protein
MRACVRAPAGTTLEYDETARAGDSTAHSKAKQSRTKRVEAAHHTLLSNRGADPLCCRSCRFAAQRTTWPSVADNDDSSNDERQRRRRTSKAVVAQAPFWRGAKREREPGVVVAEEPRPCYAMLRWLRGRKAMRHGAPSTGFQSMSYRIGMAVKLAGGTTRRRVAGRVAGRL